MKKLLLILIMLISLSGYSQNFAQNKNLTSKDKEVLKANTGLLIIELYKDYCSQLDTLHIETTYTYDTIKGTLIGYYIPKEIPTFEGFIEWLQKDYLPKMIKDYETKD
jgi:hypothetical protein